ncbi:MAG: hypothetical protein HY650_06055 [Acidobacteria bacterium]|nr:hypothetical protein [Acidobacteriota bacterium]
MDIDRLFLRLNSGFSVVVALDYAWNALLEDMIVRERSQSGWLYALHQTWGLALRDLSYQSPYIAALIQYIPTFMMISLMICIYIQVRERSSILSRWALGGGIALAIVLLARRIYEGAIASAAYGYIDAASWLARREILGHAIDLTRLDVLQRVFLGEASALALSLLGILFLMGHGFERWVGGAFIVCFLAVVFRPGLHTIGIGEATAIFLLPSVAFAMSAVYLWMASSGRPKKS